MPCDCTQVFEVEDLGLYRFGSYMRATTAASTVVVVLGLVSGSGC